MNSTTVTISDATRRELLKIAAELQAKRGKKIDYEEVIEYLIQKSSRNPALFRAATSPKGASSEGLQEALKEGRAEDRQREEELERRYT